MAVIKVPGEIQDVFAESVAADELATLHDRGWFPSLKALYFKRRAVQMELLAWRALRVTESGWDYNPLTGEATKEETVIEKAKKPRNPRAKKAVAPTKPQPTNEGGAE